MAAAALSVAAVPFPIAMGEPEARVSYRRLIQWKDHTMSTFQRFIEDETGATAIEYALVAGLIAIAIVTSVRLIGTTLSTTFNSVATGI